MIHGEVTFRGEHQMFLAGHKDIASTVQDKLQTAYDSMVKDGTETPFRRIS